ncbi:MAG TPA: hypothetical protein VMW83_14555 [Spirochaetia bacterium]|nr:hypothetical protein [Spirochaetia bacterium]
MIFKIINMSDPYTMESDDFEVACVANVFLGEGAYGLRQVNGGDNKMPILFFGADKWFVKTFGTEFELVLKRCLEEKKDCLIRTLNSVLIGSSSDRKIFYDDLSLIDDAQKQEEWRNRWHDQHRSSVNDIAAVAHRYASVLEKAAAKDDGSDQAE